MSNVKLIVGILLIVVGIVILFISKFLIVYGIILGVLGIGFIIFGREENMIEEREDISLNKRKIKR